MSIIGAVSSTALKILQQPHVLVAPDEPAPAGVAMLAAANGIKIPGVSDAPSQAKAKVSESLFDTRANAPQMKVHLFERLGGLLGVSMDSFGNLGDYTKALRDAVQDIRRNPEGEKILVAIEKELGLDELGLTIDELIDAVDAPEGEAGKKLNDALQAVTGEDTKEAAGKVGVDEIGLYGP